MRFAVVLLSFLLFTYTGFAGSMELIGAGATFPYPLYSKMFDAYYKEFGVKVNYQAIGSGGGIRQLINRAVDFGATDAFLSDEEMREAPGEIVHIPTCVGAVVVAYNIPGVKKLRLTGELLADIFLGKIRSWSDPRIVQVNPGVKLPSMRIITVHRSDGSGTTFIFTNYLSKVSEEWRKKVGFGKAVRWPGGLGAKGNPGVAGLIKQIPGTIGYIELAYALQNCIPYASIKNRSGSFVEPTLDSIMEASNVELPKDARVMLTDTPSPKGYPLSGFTWIIVYKDQKYGSRTFDRAKALVDLLWWMVHEGQRFTKPLDYAPLSKRAVKLAEEIIKSINYGGRPILKP